MSGAPGIRKLREGARWITNEQRQRADRVNKAETNYAGVEIPKKTVIKLHETFVDGRLPSAESLKSGVIDFYRQHGRRPIELYMTGRSITSIICIDCPEISAAGEWPIVSLRIRQGEFVELK